MITLTQFYKGRDRLYAKELTAEIATNAEETIQRVNQLLILFYASNPNTALRGCTSGWRPPAVNAGVRGSAKKSKHLLGLAIDVEDDDEALDKWCMTPKGKEALATVGLWMEHPNATPRWCHLQTVPPGSGNRVFFP